MLSCPRCAHPLFLGQASRFVMHACGGCGGLWLDRGAAAQVNQSLSEDALGLARQAASHGRQPIDARRAAPCAVCRRPMRRFVAPDTSLELDECPEHGTWFDRGELEMVARAVQHRSAPGARPPAPPGHAPPGYAVAPRPPGASGHAPVPPGAFPPPSGGGRAGHVALAAGAAAVGVGAVALASSQAQVPQLQGQAEAQSSSWGEAASEAVEVVSDMVDVVDVVDVAGAAVRGAQIAGHAAASAAEALADGELLASGAEAATSIVGGIFSLIGSLLD